MKKKIVQKAGIIVAMLLLVIPLNAYASTSYPDDVVPINYDSGLDVYSMEGTGDEATSSFYLTPTTGLSTTVDTITTMFVMENTSIGPIVPSHFFGFDSDYMQFKNMYAAPGNDVDSSTWTASVRIDGNNTVYFFTFGNVESNDWIDTGESVNAWIDYTWTGSSNLLIDEEVSTTVTGASQDWTVLNGWSVAGLFAMDIQVGSNDSMLLEVQQLATNYDLPLTNSKLQQSQSHSAEVAEFVEQKRVLQEKIKKGEVKPVNLTVNVYDEDNNLIWTGNTDEWQKVGRDIIKSVKEKQEQK